MNAYWYLEARCTEVDQELFFPEPGRTADNARSVCARCPVRQPCLQFALDNRIDHGIFGGLTPTERRQHDKADTP